MSFNRFWLACFCLVVVTSAHAQCPPGMLQPGGASFCVPGNAPAPYYVPSREDQIQSMTVRSMPDPMEGRVNAMRALLEAESLGMVRIQSAISTDPKMRELAKGWWEYFTSDTNPQPAYGCAAAYINLDGALLLSEVVGHKQGVMTFLGRNIPRPKNPSKVSSTLDQNDGHPQNVKVLNFAVPNSTRLGAISFEVPTMDLLLDNIEDKQSFDVKIDQQSIINIQWKNGIEARNQLRKCMHSKK